MFIGLVSPKQFFSLIHRKIIENYKLNQFDTNLDSFEVKIGFGAIRKMSKKEIDTYFSYNATANMNWWTFYAPSTIATVTTLIFAKGIAPIMRDYDEKYALAMFEAIVVLCYTFAARIKIIDIANRDEALRWTVDLLFSTMLSMDEELDEDIVNEIKPMLLQEIEVFIFLMYTFVHLNTLLDDGSKELTDVIEYVLGEHNIQWLSWPTKHALHTDMDQRSRKPYFDGVDDELLGNILPSDSMIIALLNDSERYLIAENFFTCFIAEKKLDDYLTRMSWEPELWKDLIDELFDYSYLKQHAHTWIKDLSRSKFGHQKSYQTEKEIDTFMSTVEEKWSFEWMKIPKAIKQESILMDKILNFYIGFVWGLFIARWDSYGMRVFHRPLLNTLNSIVRGEESSHDSLYYYGWILYHYSKNLYYYQYAFDNIKAWNESFHLPLQVKSQQVYTNAVLIEMISECAFPSLFQDMMWKTLTITVSNEIIIHAFRESIGPSLQAMLSRPRDLIDLVYGPVFSLCKQWESLREATIAYWQDTKNLKENLYTLDFWLRWEAVDYISQSDTLHGVYNTSSIISIIAMIRDTWTWRMIFIDAVTKEKETTPADINALRIIYVVDVLNLSQQFAWMFRDIGNQANAKYGMLIETYTKLDDTPAYMKIWIESRRKFADEMEDKKVETMVTWEDIVWFRSYLKTIQYYTKRYLKPKA